MTRRGSLAYYLAAVVVGCFFASLFLYLSLEAPRAWEPGRSAADFFAFYFFSIPYGVFTAVLAAATLRWLMSAMRWRGLWQWALSGAVLSTLLVVVLDRLAFAFPHADAKLSTWGMVLLGGSVFLVRGGVWPATLAGALTAVVLRRMHLAFEPRGESGAEPLGPGTPTSASGG